MDLFKRPRQLRVSARAVVLRPHLDFDVRVRAVIFHLPADVREPKAELRLRGESLVRQRVPRGDADHAAPGALADQGAQLHQLKAVAEDVAVGAGVFVGDGHHGAGGRLARVGPDAEVAALNVADAPAREFLQQKLRDMPAAVETHVHDQRIPVDLDREVAVELGIAARAHVGDVQVAAAAIGFFVDEAAIVLDPVPVAQAPFGFERFDGECPRLVVVGRAHGQSNFSIGPVHQQFLRRTQAADRLVVDAHNQVAGAQVDARARQRRRVFRVPRIALDDAHNAPGSVVLVPDKIRAQEAHPITRAVAHVAAEDVGVRTAEFTLHLP